VNPVGLFSASTSVQQTPRKTIRASSHSTGNSGDEKKGAFGFLGEIAHDSFDLHPLAEQFACHHARGWSHAWFRDRPDPYNPDVRTIDERGKQARHRGAFDFHHLT